MHMYVACFYDVLGISFWEHHGYSVVSFRDVKIFIDSTYTKLIVDFFAGVPFM